MNTLPELLERFRRGPELMAVVLTGVGIEEQDWTPAPDKWSLRTIIAHTADSEIVGAYRMRSVLAEENPVLRGYDEKLWAANLDYAQRKPSQSLETFRRTRAENYALLKNLPEAAFDRIGAHTDRGPVTLFGLLETYALHAEGHAQQIQNLRDAYKEYKGRK